MQRWKAGELLVCPALLCPGMDAGNDQTLAGAALGGDGVPIPGNDWTVLWSGWQVGIGHSLESMISEVLSNRSDSEIQWDNPLGFLTINVFFR